MACGAARDVRGAIGRKGSTALISAWNLYSANEGRAENRLLRIHRVEAIKI
jgi:hypothetical protein